MTSGILCINKPVNQSSYDQIRKLVKLKKLKIKIGHAGTLDPFAEGLMILLLGKAVKVQDYFLSLDKVYQTKIKLGLATDTLDITGKVINQSNDKVALPQKAIQEIINKKLSGLIYQTPPKYSAIKIKGRRAYHLARAGEDFSLPARKVTIYKNEVLSWDRENQILALNIHCSSGTYIRSIARDLGILLSTFATTLSIKRKQIGNFNLTWAKEISLANILEQVVRIEKIIPNHKVKLSLDEKQLKLFQNGSFQSFKDELKLGYNSIYHKDEMIAFLFKAKEKTKIIFYY